MTRVLLLSPVGVQGGAERSLVALADRLPPLGFPTEVVLLQPGPLEDWLAAIGQEPIVLDSRRLRDVRRAARTVRALRRIITTHKIGVVVSNMTKGHLYGGVAAWRAGVPAIWWDRGMATGDHLERLAGLVKCAAVVCDSGAAADARRRVTPHRRIERVHLGVPVDRLAAARGSGEAIRQTLGWADKTIVGIPGRLQAWKRQDVFLRAAGILSEQHSSLRFLVIGGAILGREGVYPDELRRLAAELGLGDVVHFAGHQPDVYPWLDALDIVVHASSGEPFGMVIAEAMALGKPVISVADGGPLEIVEDGRSGLLVAPGDPARLAAAIDRVLADGTFAAALGAEAERRARSLFSEDHMARAFGEIIRSAVLGESQ